MKLINKLPKIPEHGCVGGAFEVFFNTENDNTYYLKLTNKNFIKMNRQEFNELLETL